MVRTVVRRACDPVVVQKLWNMVECSRVNKQATTLDRVTRAVMKELSANEQEAAKHIDDALSDGLLERYSWTVAKGSRAGESMEGVRIPEFKEPIDKRFEHDWYCFRCHKPGEVLECTECFRVWHPACLPGKAAPTEGVFLCPTCVMNSKAEYKRKQIRKLLEFATHRLKGKPLWKDLGKIGYLDDQGRNDYLLFKYLDLNVISRKIKDGRYRSLESFLVDVNTLLHDVCVMYGDLSNMADLARVLLREIEVEIYEIRLCTNCYINAKARPSEWVSKPCRPAHELVWAKLKGFPFWPAKVLEEKDTTYEVRFFGSYHERAAVTKESTRPYDIPPDELGVRRTPAFQRALNEVQKLQKLVGEGYYTSSSGDSDMPPSDDDWSDELYILAAAGGAGSGGSAARKRRPSSAVDATGAKKAALTSPSSGVAAGSSSGLSPTRRPPATGANSASKSKQKNKKKKPASKRRRAAAASGTTSESDAEDDDDMDDENSITATAAAAAAAAATSAKNEAMPDADSESSESRDEWRIRVGLSPTGSGRSGTGVGAGSSVASGKATRKKPATPAAPSSVSTAATGAKKAAAPAATATSSRRSAPTASSASAAAASTASAASSKLRRGAGSSGSGAITVATGGVGAAIMASPTASVQASTLDANVFEEALAAERKKLEEAVTAARMQAEAQTKAELDKSEADLRGEFQRELENIMHQHREAIANTKRRQWCYNCLEEAMYHCCWNTSYCSIKCQQDHWHKEHKRVCRRKR
uniref:Zinc finger MYND domain-containing protein 11 n=1 Tax=Macrostomum lignano TaxID=282301 RepID=A0A1I8H649_9PLAT